MVTHHPISMTLFKLRNSCKIRSQAFPLPLFLCTLKRSRSLGTRPHTQLMTAFTHYVKYWKGTRKVCDLTWWSQTDSVHNYNLQTIWSRSYQKSIFLLHRVCLGFGVGVLVIARNSTTCTLHFWMGILAGMVEVAQYTLLIGQWTMTELVASSSLA